MIEEVGVGKAKTWCKRNLTKLHFSPESKTVG